MAVNFNDSNKPVVGLGRLWQGIVPVKIVAFNPNKERLEKMGYQPKEEPKYTGIEIEQEGQGKRIFSKLVAYVENKELGYKDKIEFLVSERDVLSQQNKTQFINNQVQSAYEDNLEGLDAEKWKWFRKETARVAKEGEVDVHNLIAAWANVNFNKDEKTGKHGECQVDIIKIAKNDMSELNQLLEIIKKTGGGGEFKVFGGVVKVEKDGKTSYFQRTYTKWFGRATSDATTALVNALKGQYSQFKGVLPFDTIELTEFKIPSGYSASVPDSETNAGSGSSDAEADFK